MMVNSSKVSSRQSQSSDASKSMGFHVGVDVHKRSYHVACWNEEHGLIATWVQPSSAGLLIEKLAPIGRTYCESSMRRDRPALDCSENCRRQAFRSQ